MAPGSMGPDAVPCSVCPLRRREGSATLSRARSATGGSPIAHFPKYSLALFEFKTISLITELSHAIDRTRNFAPAHICDYFASGRRQNHFDGKVPAVRRGGAARWLRHRAQEPTRHYLRLDGAR